MKYLATAVALALLFVCPPSAARQDDEVRLETTLVNVYVKVVDRAGRPAPDLRREDFRVFEDGVEQEIAYFGPLADPFTVVLALDARKSDGPRVEEVREAASAFVDALRPGDRAMIVSVGEETKTLAGPTGDAQALKASLRNLKAGRSPARLYDTVSSLLRGSFRGVSGRKALVLLTDGIDRFSYRGSYEDTVLDVERGDVLVYPVQYDSMDRTSKKVTGNAIFLYEVAAADVYLRDMARKSGTQVLRVDREHPPKTALLDVARELRQQYSIGYHSGAPRPGERRTIGVSLRRPDLLASARGGDAGAFEDANNRTGSSATFEDEQRRWRDIPSEYFSWRDEAGNGRMCGPFTMPFFSGEVRMRLASLARDDPKTGDVINVLAHVDPSSLDFQDEADGTKSAVVEVRAAAYNNYGAVSGAVSIEATLRERADRLRDLIRDGATFDLKIPVRRVLGILAEYGYTYVVHQARVVVRDARSGRCGYASQFMSLTSDDTTIDLSGIMTSPDPEASTEDLTALPADDRVDALRWGPVVLRRFRRGAALNYSYTAYHASPFRLNDRKHLVSRATIERADGRSMVFPDRLVDVDGQRDKSRLVVRDVLPLDPDLPPGWYVLKVEVTDKRQKPGEFVSRAVQWIDFEIVP